MAASPTSRLTQVEAAYWTDVTTKEHLRWVMPKPEDQLLDALSRLHAAGRDSLVDGGRLVGMFRAHGLLTPVWDLPARHGTRSARGPGPPTSRPLWPRPWRTTHRSPATSGPHARASPTVRSRSADASRPADRRHQP